MTRPLQLYERTAHFHERVARQERFCGSSARVSCVSSFPRSGPVLNGVLGESRPYCVIVQETEREQ